MYFIKKMGEKANDVFPKESGNFLVKNATVFGKTGKLSQFCGFSPVWMPGRRNGRNVSQGVYIIS